MPLPFPRQRGAALIEAALAVLALCALATTLVEASRWHTLQYALYAALTDAARAGAVAHAAPHVIAQAFTRALPRAARRALPGAAGWRIEVLQPDTLAYARHASAGLALPPEARGWPAIRNDHQAEQLALRPGLAPDVFQANRLRLRLRYPVRPLAPWSAALLRALAAGAADACTRATLAAGALPLQLTLEIDMQSHPVQFPDAPPVWVRTHPCPPLRRKGRRVGKRKRKRGGRAQRCGVAGRLPVAGAPGRLAAGGGLGAVACGVELADGRATPGGRMCTNTSPSRIMPSSPRARSSMAPVPVSRSRTSACSAALRARRPSLVSRCSAT